MGRFFVFLTAMCAGTLSLTNPQPELVRNTSQYLEVFDTRETPPFTVALGFADRRNGECWLRDLRINQEIIYQESCVGDLEYFAFGWSRDQVKQCMLATIDLTAGNQHEFAAIKQGCQP